MIDVRNRFASLFATPRRLSALARVSDPAETADRRSPPVDFFVTVRPMRAGSGDLRRASPDRRDGFPTYLGAAQSVR